MKSGIVDILLIFAVAVTVSSQGEILVTTKTGPVRGVKISNPIGKVVDTFYGIPFAEPPVGDLRFLRPRPIKPWSQVLDATTKPNACYQITDMPVMNSSATKQFSVNTPIKEDCLYLNIWVPNPRPAKSGVLVWIYGGGFISGSSALDMYDGSILASKENIIVASMNYRVSSLGFLYLGTEKAPGNMGLLDQVMALEWIHNNIESFGGDPNEITIFGESAGAASVSYHLLSPLSRNLFSRAIMGSGASTAKWAWASPEKLKNFSLQLADKAGCSGTEGDLDALVTCLKQIDPNTLMKANPKIEEFLDFGFVPVTDNYFLTKSPKQYILESDFKKCPILLGSTLNEGTLFMFPLISGDLRNGKGLTISRKRFLELLLQIDKNFTSIVGEAIANKYTYWSRKSIVDGNYLDPVDKIIGDRYFHCPLNQYAEDYFQKENVYMYHFTHTLSHAFWPKWIGVAHGSDLVFVFGHPLKNSNILGMKFTNEEKILSQRVMRYWSNFAKSGNPNSVKNLEEEVEWPRFNDDKKYLILNTNPFVDRGLRVEQCHFWDQEYPALLQGRNSHQESFIESSCEI